MYLSICCTALCIASIILCWFWFAFRAAIQDNGQLRQRLFTVAQNLQLAERVTGQPFYTGLLDGALPCEKKELLYLGMRNDLYGRCTQMLQHQLKMPVIHEECDEDNEDHDD